MRALYYTAALLLCAAAAIDLSEDDMDEPAITEVTCGSLVKLRHVATGFRLHSHKVTYGSGSGQQSVTGFPEYDDTNSFWLIRGKTETSCPQGRRLSHGDEVRLLHQNTLLNLHSHLHQSPLTRNQEVSCFGENGSGDTGDFWAVETADKGPWKRGQTIRLRHVDTGKYLAAMPHAKFNNPIPGQLEVCAISSADANTAWATEEGYYFPVRA
eukprot:m51a1_g10189 hypothetical protein (212) ;mRNA; f:5308-6528